MIDPHSNDRLDVELSTQFVHRVRFTRDILGADQDVLADLLQGSGSQKPRVQFWVDEDVARADPRAERRHRRRDRGVAGLSLAIAVVAFSTTPR